MESWELEDAVVEFFKNCAEDVFDQSFLADHSWLSTDEFGDILTLLYELRRSVEIYLPNHAYPNNRVIIHEAQDHIEGYDQGTVSILFEVDRNVPIYFVAEAQYSSFDYVRFHSGLLDRVRPKTITTTTYERY